jgi:Secretory lipase
MTRTQVLRTSALLALAFVIVWAGSPPPASAADWHGARGRSGALVSFRRIAVLSRHAVAAELAAARMAPGDPALGAGQVRSGVAAYRVVYRTTGLSGGTVLASGLVAFPTGKARRPLSLVDNGHGTTATRADVPSAFGLRNGLGIEGRWTSELFASAGFAVVLPDYLGMGVSRVRPQYEVARTETSASVDLLRAARRLATETGRRLDGRVFLTGFSQGAAASLAIAHRLQSRAIAGLRPAAVGAISGPYELRDAELPAILDGRVSPGMTSYLLGYVLTAWNPIYHLFARPSVAFRAPYAADIEDTFDGDHADAQIATELPGDFRQLITARYLHELEHPSGQLLAALRVNSTCAGWDPRIPVRLYAARGDRTVAESNALACARRLGARGAAMRVIELGAVGHDVSDFLGLPRVLRWFRSFR